MLQTLYKRAACTEEFFDLVNTAHVENGHIGLSQTYAAVSVKFGSLCVCVCAYVLLFVCVCVCVCVRTRFNYVQALIFFSILIVQSPLIFPQK